MADAAYAALLAAAGGALSLAEAAEALAISRPAMHALISSGRVLGMMHGDQIVVPRLQFRSRGGQCEIVPGIERVVRLFDETTAGPWAALPFLLDPDPNLGAAPVAALRAGQVEAVEHATRAFLRTDEDERSSAVHRMGGRSLSVRGSWPNQTRSDRSACAYARTEAPKPGHRHEVWQLQRSQPMLPHDTTPRPRQPASRPSTHVPSRPSGEGRFSGPFPAP